MAKYILISLGSSSADLDTAVEAAVPQEDRHKIETGKWLVSSTSVTSKDVSEKLKLPDSTTYLICPIRGYFGRAKPDIWEWLAAPTKTNA
jgi:hypothetical protein